MTSAVIRPVNLLLLVLCFCLCAYGQQERSTALRFPACYEVISLSWDPPDNSIRAIPPRFRLTAEHHVFPLASETNKIPWGSWETEGKNLALSFGFLGGFRGTLKPSDGGEFRGKLKEHCDYHCGWKKRVGLIRLRNIACVD